MCDQALRFAAVLLLSARGQGRPSGPRVQPSPCAHQFFFLHSFLLTHIALLCARLRTELISSSQPSCELSTVLKALFHLGKMRLRSELCTLLWVLQTLLPLLSLVSLPHPYAWLRAPWVLGSQSGSLLPRSPSPVSDGDIPASPGTGRKGAPKRDQVRAGDSIQCLLPGGQHETEGRHTTFRGVQQVLQGGSSPRASGVSACLASRGPSVLYSGPSFPDVCTADIPGSQRVLLWNKELPAH